MAQTRAAGWNPANHWMHSAWVTAKGEKMSKSLGNGLSVPAVLSQHRAWVVRYALGSVQYRSMLEWSDQTLQEAQSAYDRIVNFIERADAIIENRPSREEIISVDADDLPHDFVIAMNDDINVSGATAAVFTAIRQGNTLLSQLASSSTAVSGDLLVQIRACLIDVRAMLDTLGLDPLAEPWVSEDKNSSTDSAEHQVLDSLIQDRLQARAKARKSKDFATADAIRDALKSAGIVIEDSAQGSTWSLR
jgi:cysteinyl-tRNA synthetase